MRTLDELDRLLEEVDIEEVWGRDDREIRIVRSICPRSLQRPCKLCEIIGMKRGTSYCGQTLTWRSFPGLLYSRKENGWLYPDVVREEARRLSAREVFYSLCMLLDGEKKEKIYLFKIPYSIYSQLKAYALLEEYQDFVDLENGYVFMLTKEKDQKTERAAYRIAPLPQKLPVSPDYLTKLGGKLTFSMIEKIVEASVIGNSEAIGIHYISPSRIDFGRVRIRFLPLHVEKKTWVARVFYHFGISQSELGAINLGEKSPLSVFPPMVRRIIEKIDRGEFSEENYVEEMTTKEIVQVEEIPSSDYFESPVNVLERSKPVCFGSKKLFNHLEICSTCDFYEDCQQEVEQGG